MLYECRACGAGFASQEDDVTYCCVCGEAEAKEHNLFGRGVADNH